MWGLSIEMRHFRWQSINEILLANIWKNCLGLQQRNNKAKSICHSTLNPGRPELNLYDIFTSYISVVAWGRPFYRRPFGDRNHVSESNSLVNKLGTIIKTMYTESRFVGNYSNHSGKLTCRTTLFQSEFEEQRFWKERGILN